MPCACLSLPAPRFLDQTIGGAVATASHGSSMKWGSLSSQVGGACMHLQGECSPSGGALAGCSRARSTCSAIQALQHQLHHCMPTSPPQLVSLRIVLANGTLAEFSPKKNPHLFNAVGACCCPAALLVGSRWNGSAWNAVRAKSIPCILRSAIEQLATRIPACPMLHTGASVGRLGIIADLTFRIVPQQAVQRTLKVGRLCGWAPESLGTCVHLSSSGAKFALRLLHRK